MCGSARTRRDTGANVGRMLAGCWPDVGRKRAPGRAAARVPMLPSWARCRCAWGSAHHRGDPLVRCAVRRQLGGSGRSRYRPRRDVQRFFTRALSTDAWPRADAHVVCPVDGALSQRGCINGERRRGARESVHRRRLCDHLLESQRLSSHSHAVDSKALTAHSSWWLDRPLPLSAQHDHVDFHMGRGGAGVRG